LKTNFFRISFASGWLLVMNLRKPCIINDELVSPGCTLANNIMYFLNSCCKSISGSSLSSSSIEIFWRLSYYTLVVIVSKGMSTPERLLHKVAS
jgi:hypothetical protein